MKLEEIIKDGDLTNLDGEYRVVIEAGNVVVEDCDKTKEYILALEQKLTYSAGWLFWFVLLVYVAVVSGANSGVSENVPALKHFSGWAVGLTLAVFAMMTIAFIPSVFNKRKAEVFAAEFAEKARELEIDVDQLLAQDWFDKKAFTVKSMVLNGRFKRADD